MNKRKNYIKKDKGELNKKERHNRYWRGDRGLKVGGAENVYVKSMTTAWVQQSMKMVKLVEQKQWLNAL